MLLTSLFIRLLPDDADSLGLPMVPLIGSNVLDAAMAVLRVVTINKAINPGSHRDNISEAPQRIALEVFRRAEQ